MKVTRTITTFHVTAIAPNFSTKTFDVIGEVDYVGTHCTKTVARKALQDAGYTIPKGTEVTYDKVSDAIYAVDLEDFMRMAVLVDASDVENDE